MILAFIRPCVLIKLAIIYDYTAHGCPSYSSCKPLHSEVETTLLVYTLGSG